MLARRHFAGLSAAYAGATRHEQREPLEIRRTVQTAAKNVVILNFCEKYRAADNTRKAIPHRYEIAAGRQKTRASDPAANWVPAFHRMNKYRSTRQTLTPRRSYFFSPMVSSLSLI
jgi:hypothetical protein